MTQEHRERKEGTCRKLILVCAGPYVKCFANIDFICFSPPGEIGGINPHLVKKRLREVKEHAQGHTALGFISGLSGSRVWAFLLQLTYCPKVGSLLVWF